ncbi:MAG: AAA family ATPase [Candidatus Acidiferrales bacterium]
MQAPTAEPPAVYLPTSKSAGPLVINPTVSSASAKAALLQQLGIHTPDTLDALCAQEGQKPFVVDGLIPTGSISLIVGDSGLGKSPLIYQLGLCVAAGIPWLDMRTRQGKVLYLDYENGALGSKSLRDSIMQHLQLQECPENFRYSQDVQNSNALTQAVETLKPTLVVIDTLRSFDPSVEADNPKAGAFLKSLRKLAHKDKVSFVLIHHIKKQDKKGFLDARANLETDPPLHWLSLACGARALVNQSDVRIGVDRTSKGNASLIVRGHVRITGEVGPFYLERALNDDEQPIGYRRLEGVEFLDNRDQQDAFERLPVAFSFKDAKAIYGRRDQATIDFLQKCERAGILRKIARGRYEKVSRATPE